MNIAVAQSGGPTAVINASLLGVFKGALKYKEIDKIYGAVNGVEGVLNDNFVDLRERIRTEDDMALLRQTPSAALRSCRHKLKGEEEFEKVRKTLESRGVGAFFYIGGNDSMDTVDKLSAYFEKIGCGIKVIGVPKTIDNDLYITDHTPGFGSAAKFVATSMREMIRDGSVYDLDSVLIVEIMGRDAGWLTASSSVLRAFGETAPQLIYLPESRFSVQGFLDDVRRVQKTTRTVVVAVSEGIELEDDDKDDGLRYNRRDDFGHVSNSGVGKRLECIVRRDLGCKARSVELNILQRCSTHISSETDLNEAEAVGAAAVDAAMDGLTGRIMVIKRVSDAPYSVSIENVAACEIANKVRYFPSEWITDGGSNVSDDAVRYVLPLINGEPEIRYENGLPAHFILVE